MRHALLGAALLVCSAGVRLQSSQDLAAKGVADTWHELKDGPHKLAWFHAPGTATSFGATLMHYASPTLPRSVGAEDLRGWDPFFRFYPPAQWFKDGLWVEKCDHAPVTDEVYQEYKGHFAGLFRKPMERIASKWRPNFWLPIDAYARRTNGTVALELAGEAFGEEYTEFPGRKYCRGLRNASEGEAPPPNLDLAVQRLREGFMFVGLMEEFDLSVCLFHAMFGGECLPVEFENMRKGGPRSSYPELADLYNVDQVLYDIAAERFWRDVKAFGVHREFCRKLCANVGHIFERTEDDAGGNSTVNAYAERIEYDWPGRWVLDEGEEQ
uniref:Uncharacterized protein n=1 Tax=Alexandrium andersonii TaxID=327968 RepID=A0A7S2AX14_9DINO|mmetsp:Transcript_19429/g.44218  ORF Transcript_19429/g.44218 Transcript_19429/m.44218 type:complete len:326 (+) Transcript_19429:91-1068(+)